MSWKSVRQPATRQPSNKTDSTNNGSSWTSDEWSAFGGVMKGAGAVGSIILGANQLGLAKDEYNNQLEITKRNLTNQAKMTNNEILRRRAAEWARMNKAGVDKAAYDKQTNGMKVSDNLNVSKV